MIHLMHVLCETILFCAFSLTPQYSNSMLVDQAYVLKMYADWVPARTAGSLRAIGMLCETSAESECVYGAPKPNMAANISEQRLL